MELWKEGKKMIEKRKRKKGTTKRKVREKGGGRQKSQGSQIAGRKGRK